MPHGLMQAVAGQAEPYYARAEPPPSETEGSHLLISADCTGVRIVGQPKIVDEQDGRPRRGKGEKRGTRKEAVVTADAVITAPWYVMEYLWHVGTALHGETGSQRAEWVENKLRALLTGGSIVSSVGSSRG